MKSWLQAALTPLLFFASLEAQAQRLNHAQQYQTCLALVRQTPQEALDSALTWRDSGGSFAARHCAALALVELRRPREAADGLEQLAQEMNATGQPALLIASILSQAGQAWYGADELSRADAAFAEALRINPSDAEAWQERARAMAAAGQWSEARTYLDRALALQPQRAEAYAMRASTRRYLQDLTGAQEDIETALLIDSNLAAAYLERGNIRAARGERDGARADWLKVRLLLTEGPLFDAAGRNLERLDLR